MRRTSKSGYVLIQALVAIAGLLALLAILAADQRAELGVIQARLRERRAEQAVYSAAALATEAISQANTNIVGQNDAWAQLGSNANTTYTFDNGSTLRMQVVDCASMLNPNTSTEAQLQQLPLTQEQIDCLLDWIQPSQTARSDGAKDSFYNSLPQPYNTALLPLTNVNEMLLIDNWTAQNLYQPPSNVSGGITMPTDPNGNTLPLASILNVDSGSPNTQASGAARINVDARGINTGALIRAGVPGGVAAQISRNAPIASFTRLFSLPGVNSAAAQALLNVVSLSAATRSTGLLNINTASAAALETIPGISSAQATTIVAQQQSGYSTLGSLATQGGLTPAELGEIAPSVEIGSDTWVVQAYGEDQGVSYAAQVTIGIRNGQPQMIKWERINVAGIPSWWGWIQQSTASTPISTLQITQTQSTGAAT